MAVRYARSGTHHLAFDTLGDGPLDILHAPSMTVSIGEVDGEPHVARYYRRLASFGRVIHFDPRGIGLSDPIDPTEPYTTESAAADALAVLDAAGSGRAALVGWSGAGAIAVELAAAHPERVRALVLGDTYARSRQRTATRRVSIRTSSSPSCATTRIRRRRGASTGATTSRCWRPACRTIPASANG